MPALLTKLGITRWDVLIVGDGSGTGWKDSCGWAHTVVDRLTRTRKMLRGAVDGGSVNLAEMMPTLHGLTWFHKVFGEERLKVSGRLAVHVVTDSRTTVEHGTAAVNLTRPLPESSLLFWSGIREYHKLGYDISFHWLPRSTTELNQAADLVASLARRANMDVEDKRLTAAQSQRIRRAIHLLMHGPDAAAAITGAIHALQTLMSVHGTDADKAAVGLESAVMRDPRDGQEINLHEVTPDGHSS